MIRLTFLLYLLTPFPLIAATLHFESGPQQKTLVELFTSEGCSSCPPAEEYLNKFKQSNDLWKKIIPVAFHVNYWDYLGWQDRYAHQAFGQRQSQYARLKRVSTVYTPAFIVNGEGWRPGLFSRDIHGASHEPGKLVVDIQGDQLKADFHSAKSVKKSLTLNVAILGMGLSDFIERGENQGRTARHEFVVVGFDSLGSDNANWKMTLPKKHYQNIKEQAIAIWVSTNDNPTPIQAVGGNLPQARDF